MVLRIRPIPIALWIALGLLCVFAVPCRADDLPKQDEKVPKREVYRYDGKTFDQWRTSMLTELKPERRVDALVAMKAFGMRGYEKEAVAAVMLLVEDHFREHGQDQRNYDGSGLGIKPGEDKVLAAARAALVAMQPTSQPLLLEGLKSPNAKIRWFCQDYFVGGRPTWSPCSAPTVDAVPVLMDIVQNENLDAAVSGVDVLADQLGLSEENTYLRDFREPLAEQMKNEARAAKFIKGLGRTVGKSEKSVRI